MVKYCLMWRDSLDTPVPSLSSNGEGEEPRKLGCTPRSCLLQSASRHQDWVLGHQEGELGLREDGGFGRSRMSEQKVGFWVGSDENSVNMGDKLGPELAATRCMWGSCWG